MIDYWLIVTWFLMVFVLFTSPIWLYAIYRLMPPVYRWMNRSLNDIYSKPRLTIDIWAQCLEDPDFRRAYKALREKEKTSD